MRSSQSRFTENGH